MTREFTRFNLNFEWRLSHDYVNFMFTLHHLFHSSSCFYFLFFFVCKLSSGKFFFVGKFLGIIWNFYGKYLKTDAEHQEYYIYI